MELPLLKLYLRRMFVMPQGLPWRDALHTPWMRALLALLGWTVAACISLFVAGYIHIEGYSVSIDAFGAAMRDDRAQLIFASLTLVGAFYLLFVVAEQMAGLARQGKSERPDWHATPLSSSNAVGSHLLVALFAALPAATGLGVYVAIASFFSPLSGEYSTDYHYGYPPLIGLSLGGFALLMLRLPAFALFTGCVSLALRQHRWGQYVPALAALAGTALTQFQFNPEIALPAQWKFEIAAKADWVRADCVTLGLLALLVVPVGAAALCWLANGRGHGMLGGMAIILWLVLPPVSVPFSVAAEVSVPNSVQAEPYGSVVWKWPIAIERHIQTRSAPVQARTISGSGLAPRDVDAGLIGINALASLAYPLPQRSPLADAVIPKNDHNSIQIDRKILKGDVPVSVWSVQLLLIAFAASIWWLGCVAALNAVRGIVRLRVQRTHRKQEAGRLPARP